MQLFRELYPEMQVTGLADQYPVPLKKAEIDVALSWLERRLGKAADTGRRGRRSWSRWALPAVL